jgi:hypothetical protein
MSPIDKLQPKQIQKADIYSSVGTDFVLSVISAAACVYATFPE